MIKNKDVHHLYKIDTEIFQYIPVFQDLDGNPIIKLNQMDFQIFMESK